MTPIATPIRLVIVDDNPGMRRLLRAQVSFERRFSVVGEAQDGEEGVRVVGDEQPDAVILDVMMPVMDGLDAIGPMRESAPGAKIVILSSDPSFRERALEHGADGFHEKGEPFDMLAETIVRLVEGAA